MPLVPFAANSKMGMAPGVGQLGPLSVSLGCVHSGHPDVSVEEFQDPQLLFKTPQRSASV